MGQGCFEDELINGENWVAKEIPNYIFFFVGFMGDFAIMER